MKDLDIHVQHGTWTEHTGVYYVNDINDITVTDSDGVTYVLVRADELSELTNVTAKEPTTK